MRRWGCFPALVTVGCRRERGCCWVNWLPLSGVGSGRIGGWHAVVGICRIRAVRIEATDVGAGCWGSVVESDG